MTRSTGTYFTRQPAYKTYDEIEKELVRFVFIGGYYIIVFSFPVRPSSHGTEQNMHGPWREKKTRTIFYITIL